MKRTFLILSFILIALTSCNKIDINEINHSITISEYSLSNPNSVGGRDLYITLKNNSSKRIKYVTLKGDFYNNVNDKVACEVRGYGLNVKITGPLAPGEEKRYVWDCIVYNYTATRVDIDYALIEYMDGKELEIPEEYISAILERGR